MQFYYMCTLSGLESRAQLHIREDLKNLSQTSEESNNLTLMLVSRNRKLKISIAPTKMKSLEPAYSQALIQNKSIAMSQIQRVRQAGRQADSQTAMVDGVWSLDGRTVGRR